MKKIPKILTVGVCLTVFAAMIFGNDSSSGKDQPAKVGEVGKNDKVDQGNTSDKPAEVKDEYHVGDILQDGDMKIVYVASGEYKEDNEYMQPEAGKKFVFIKLAFENQGSKDEGVSSFSFECYADGYSAKEHYTDHDLSATLSPGRTTDGILVFEVPNDAQKIDFEYETNFITEKKIKFVYDGEKDSGYVPETNTGVSENAFKVGDVVESKDLNITYMSCMKDTSYSEFSEPAEGMHYVTLTFEFENKGDKDEHVSNLDFDCYADGKNCEQAYFREDSISATLSSGRKAQGTVTFVVQDDAATVEAEFVSSIWTSSRVVFTVSV